MLVKSEYSPSGFESHEAGVPIRSEQAPRKRVWLSYPDVLRRYGWSDADFHIVQSLTCSTGKFPAALRIDDSRSLSGITTGALTFFKVRFGAKPKTGWWADEIDGFLQQMRADVTQVRIVT